MSAVHEATIPVEVGGLVYFTANWRRFFLGQPETEKVTLYGDRRGRRVRFTEVKNPRTLKALRRKAPNGKPVETEEESTDAPNVPAMLVAAHVCDAPSAYEKAMAKRADERRERYAR